MNYFLDTNVGLGYVFCTDPWNDKAEHLFNKEDTFYISYCVRKEFDKKYNNILKKQRNFLYSLRDELETEDSSKKLSLKNLKLKSVTIELKKDFEDNLKEKIAEVLWKRCENKHKFDSQLKEYVCTVKDLLIYIKKFIRGFKGKLIDRTRFFKSVVIECEKRNNEYSDLNDALLNIDVHYPDNCIILDAHDLSLNDGIALNFISADNKMIEKAKNIINSLSIDNFFYLKDFC